MKALLVTAARYYYWRMFWTLHTRLKNLLDENYIENYIFIENIDKI